MANCAFSYAQEGQGEGGVPNEEKKGALIELHVVVMTKARSRMTKERDVFMNDENIWPPRPVDHESHTSK